MAILSAEKKRINYSKCNMAKTRKEFEIWANKELKKIQVILNLQSFKLLPIEQGHSKDISTAKFRFPYKDIQITYGESVFEEWKGGDKNKEAWDTLLHEMIHALTDPLYGVGHDRFVTPEQLENAREELTDNLTNIISKLVK